jgi:hypothetical protein
MAEYEGDFDRTFLESTARIVSSYAGEYDSTLLLNCFVGLLILPRQASAMFESIPNDAVEKWGIDSNAIKNFGKGPDATTIRGVVRHLRDAICHFRIAPEHRDKKCIGFTFTSADGFEATIPVSALESFTQRLAKHLLAPPSGA